MNKRFYLIAGSLVLLCLLAAAWLAREASMLEQRLTHIDQESQAKRLLELSIPRLEGRLHALLEEESAKTGDAMPSFIHPHYKSPHGERADFNKGFFLLSPAGFFVSPEARGFGAALEEKAALMDTMRRKATNPEAPYFDPLNPGSFDSRKEKGVMAVSIIENTDFSKPIKATGEPSDYFAWYADEEIIYMRRIPTTHGYAAQGFVIDRDKLAAHLLPLVEPRLKEAQLALTPRLKVGNLAPLPLNLLPGGHVDLPDTAERKEALRGTLLSAWAVCLGTALLIAVLLWLYARFERKRSDFVSAVTHELRTPLTSFSLYTEMLATQSASLSEETKEKYYAKMHRESQRLNHLVENVLSFARLSRGKVRGRQDVGLCGEMLPKLFEKIAQPLREAGFEVGFTLDKRCHHVQLCTDILTLEQILTNLADNAIKYASSPQAHIQLHVLQRHKHIDIRFRDKGPGIAQSMRRHIFAPFHRSADAEKGKKSGIGLGLALSRDLARSIGGDLQLESSEGGCTFLLSLPIG